MKPDAAKRLAIISLPFYRIARVSLAAPVLGALTVESDVVVVAPFGDDSGFQRNFAAPRTAFVRWQIGPMSYFRRLLLGISEIMRINGYWRRFRRQGMAYYVENQYTEPHAGGCDLHFSFRKRLAYSVLSRLGCWRAAWLGIDRMLGTKWANLPRLTEIAKDYDEVTLIQSANWGTQDRAMAALSRVHGWRSVLLPYTTDQLYVNGYLLNDFDALCVQGPFELRRAKNIHRIPDARIRALGSAWFRHLDAIRSAAGTSPRRAPSTVRAILYAGVSAQYFPRESELEAVDALLGLVRRSAGQLRLIYRPVEFDDDRKAAIRRRYEAEPDMELQWPGASQIGLDQYADMNHDESLRSYVRDLEPCSLFVMSSITSMCLDVAFLSGCGVISNMADRTGALARRRTDLAETDWLPGLRVVHSIPELLSAAEGLLASPAEAGEAAARLIAQWDFPASDFQKCLTDAVDGVR